MPFTIVGKQDGIRVTASRTQAASAAALAIIWRGKGFEGVRIVTGNETLSLDAFRSRFMRRSQNSRRT